MGRKTYIGVDLGGTKLLLGEADRSGTLLRQAKYPSGRLTQGEAMELIRNSLDRFLAEGPACGEVQAIGVGMVGRIDSSAGIWHEIGPGRGEPVEAAKQLGDRYGLPCFVDNDVRSAARAEMLFGCGSGHMVYINIGTGIAAGIVCGGRLLTGGHHNAGEVGHTSSGIGQRVPCECGRTDCVEMVASGIGIDRCARLLVPEYPDTRLDIPAEGRVSAAEVFRLYGRDPLCTVLTDNAAQAAANLIMNLVRVSDPDTVVLGGGVVSDGFLYRKILEHLNPYVLRYVTNGVVLTGLDPRYSGLLGACANAVKGMEEGL